MRAVSWGVGFAHVLIFALAWNEPAGAQICHSGVVAPTPRSGPNHETSEILRYDPDGSGPLGPVLVSVGHSAGATELQGVLWHDAPANEWSVLGQSMTIERAGLATAFGDALGDEGPFLAVAAGTRGSFQTAPYRAVFLYDGQTWRGQPVFPGQSILAIGAVQRGGQLEGRQVVVAGLDATGTAVEVFALDHGAWRSLGVVDGALASTGTPKLIAFDPDGSGPAQESLYLTAKTGSNRSGLFELTESGWRRVGPDATVIHSVVRIDFDGQGEQPERLVVLGWIEDEARATWHPFATFDGLSWSFAPANLWRGGMNMLERADGSIWYVESFDSFYHVYALYEYQGGEWLARLRPRMESNSRGAVAIPTDAAGTDDRLFGISTDASLSRRTVRELLFDAAFPQVASTVTVGRGFNGPITDAILTPEGWIYAIGDFTSVDGLPARYIARRSPTGEWEPVDGARFDVRPMDLTRLSDGRVLVIGSHGALGNASTFDGAAWQRYTDAGSAYFTASGVFGADNGVVSFVDFRRVGGGVCKIVQLRDGSLYPVECGTGGTLSSFSEPLFLGNGDIIWSVVPNPARPESATGLMRWDGFTWSPMGTGEQRAKNLRVMPDGTLVGMYGSSNVARWEGDQWVAQPRIMPIPAISPWWDTRFDVVGQDEFIVFGDWEISNSGYVPRHSYDHSVIARVVEDVWTDPVGLYTVSSNLDPSKAFVLPDGNIFVVGSLQLSPSYADRIWSNYAYFEIGPCSFCSPCFADWDASGGVDFGDVAAFFVDYEQGNRCADVDDSTGVDGTDMALFFAAFEAGGC